MCVLPHLLHSFWWCAVNFKFWFEIALTYSVKYPDVPFESCCLLHRIVKYILFIKQERFTDSLTWSQTFRISSVLIQSSRWTDVRGFDWYDKITQFSSNLALRLPSFQVNMVDLGCLSYISKVKMSDKCKVCFHNINARNAKAQCTYAKPIFMRVVFNMTDDNVKFLQSQSKVWRCNDFK